MFSSVISASLSIQDETPSHCGEKINTKKCDAGLPCFTRIDILPPSFQSKEGIDRVPCARRPWPVKMRRIRKTGSARNERGGHLTPGRVRHQETTSEVAISFPSFPAAGKKRQSQNMTSPPPPPPKNFWAVNEDAGLPFPAGAGRGSFVFPAGGFRPEQKSIS